MNVRMYGACVPQNSGVEWVWIQVKGNHSFTDKWMTGRTDRYADTD